MEKHLLVVDDEEGIRDLMGIAFEGLVDQIYFAEDGAVAQDLLRQHQCINCIISDISMPVCDGISLLKVVAERYPELPFIFLSDYENSSNVAISKQYNAFGFVDKAEWDQVILLVEKAYVDNLS